MTSNTQDLPLTQKPKSDYDPLKNVPADRHRAIAGSIFHHPQPFAFTFPNVPQTHVFKTPSFTSSSDSEEEMTALKTLMRKRIELTRRSQAEANPAVEVTPIKTSNDMARAPSESPSTKNSILDEISRLVANDTRSEEQLASLRAELTAASASHRQQAQLLNSQLETQKQTIRDLRAEKDALTKKVSDLKVENGKVIADAYMQRSKTSEDEAQGRQQRQKLQIRVLALQQQSVDLLAENNKLKNELLGRQDQIASPPLVGSTTPSIATKGNHPGDAVVAAVAVVDDELRKKMSQMAVSAEELGRRTREVCRMIGVDAEKPVLENLMD